VVGRFRAMGKPRRHKGKGDAWRIADRYREVVQKSSICYSLGKTNVAQRVKRGSGREMGKNDLVI